MKKGSTIARMAQWAESAPLCACTRDKISYICLDKGCPAHSSHRLYCTECLDDGIHKHFQHVKASVFAEGSEKRWTELVE